MQNYYFYASTNQFCFIVYYVEFPKLQCVLVMMYNFNTGMLPDVLNNLFTKSNTIHNIATRQTDKLHVSFFKLQNDVENDTTQWDDVVE